MDEPFINLPAVRGSYTFNTPLSLLTWFRTGGFAQVIFKPADREDLQDFLKGKPQDIPLWCFGAGSNILVRDKGLRGCVIRLGKGFSHMEHHDSCLVIGAACLDRTIALTCAQLRLSGLEFLVGIPGTMGGAIAMNAGAYGHEIKDRLQWVEWVTPEGKVEHVSAKNLAMTYRKGNLPPDVIVTRAAFSCDYKPQNDIQTTLQDFLKEKEKTQPMKGRTGGSTFKNPSSHIKAWKLIDEAGCRGLKIGDAQVSEKHCNFLLNLGSASAKDIEDLGLTVQSHVLKKTGILLEWEIIRMGEK